MWLEYAEDDALIWVAVFFLLLAVTDFFDGYLARKFDVVSDLGKLLDPLVDKLLILIPLIHLVGMRSSVTGDPWVPAWMVSLVLARELFITGLRGIAASRGRVLPAGDLGKIKTCFQVLAVFFLILHRNKLFMMNDEWMDGYYLGLQFLMASIFIGYWSAVEYIYAVAKSADRQ